MSEDEKRDKKSASIPPGSRVRTVDRGARFYGYDRPTLFHVESGGVRYFLTFSLKRGFVLDAHERAVVLESVLWGHPERWWLFGAVVMPDHVHMLIKPGVVKNVESVECDDCVGLETYAPKEREKEQERWLSISEIVKSIKLFTARRINKARGVRGALWDRDYYERSVRDEADFRVKLAYMERNPVKAGLVEDSRDWDAIWFCEEL